MGYNVLDRMINNALFWYVSEFILDLISQRKNIIDYVLKFNLLTYYVALFILGHVTELRPRQAVIEIIFHLIVLRQAQQVAVLHVHKIARACTANIHFEEFVWLLNKLKCELLKCYSLLVFLNLGCRVSEAGGVSDIPPSNSRTNRNLDRQHFQTMYQPETKRQSSS